MSRTECGRWAGLLLLGGLSGCHSEAGTTPVPTRDEPQPTPADSFAGTKAGEECEVAGVALCWCPAGRFRMGSPHDEPERRPGEDQVEVTLSKGFWMGKHEVTQGQWKRVVGEFPGKLTAGEGDGFPVYAVNFAEAEGFCRQLTEQARAGGVLPAGWEFRLPTEAQWEYACRAGTTTATSFGDTLSNLQANFQGKPYNGGEAGPSLQRAAPVGSYPANPWGLHDVHGNVFEWCRDWHHARLPGGVDPDLYSAQSTALVNRTGDRSRVRRGGCWADEGWPCRSAFRLRFEPERRSDHIGFRVVAVRP
jgi:sulfatase modifying factor 1